MKCTVPSEMQHLLKVIRKGVHSGIDSFGGIYDNRILKDKTGAMLWTHPEIQTALEVDSEAKAARSLVRKASWGVLEWLHANGVKKIKAIGIADDYCVKTTVLDALDKTKASFLDGVPAIEEAAVITDLMYGIAASLKESTPLATKLKEEYSSGDVDWHMSLQDALGELDAKTPVGFPKMLGPFAMDAMGEFHNFKGAYDSDMFDLIKEAVEASKNTGMVSEMHTITLTQDLKTKAKIPPEAQTYCWCYPSGKVSGGKPFPPELFGEIDNQMGAFAYFDGEDNIVQVTKPRLVLPDDPDAALVFDQAVTKENSDTKTWPQVLQKIQGSVDHEAEQVGQGGYFHPITIDSLKTAGARYYAWLTPEEVPPSGAFAYLVQNEESEGLVRREHHRVRARASCSLSDTFVRLTLVPFSVHPLLSSARHA